MKLAFALVASISAMPAIAQQVPATTSNIGTPALAAGTMINLRTVDGLTTKGKKLKVGDRFQMETTDEMAVNGMVLIPKGTPVTGEVTEVRNKGMWGKSGRINVRVLYMRLNGRQVRMTGAMDDKGTTGTAGVVGSVALLPVAGFFVTGTSANIPAGSLLSGFLDEDIMMPVARP